MPTKGGKIGKNEAKRMLNKLVDYASEKGSDARQELMKQVDEVTGGGISGLLSGLAEGLGAGKGGATGGGDLKNIGKIAGKIANPFGFGKGEESGGESGGGSDGVQSRGQLVKRVMAEHPKMSLGEASKYVKEHNLYVPEAQRGKKGKGKKGKGKKGGVRIFA
jgi:hypothetical protein